MKYISPSKIVSFRKKIRTFYNKNKRHFPFRDTDDPYAITVSEIMLQQTQIGRVIDKYTAWLKRFPDWQSLCEAPNREVLHMWSGLGYNRRALYLKEMALQVITHYQGQLPDDPDELRKLPGIGPYTANAIAAFAFSKRVAAVDTNIRKVLIHEFGLLPATPMKDLQVLAEKLLPRRNIRNWHYALMDFSHMAMTGKARRSIPAISRQSKFEGSLRQIRGEIIQQLTAKSRLSITTVAKKLDRTEADVRKAAIALSKDGLVRATNTYIVLIN